MTTGAEISVTREYIVEGTPSGVAVVAATRQYIVEGPIGGRQTVSALRQYIVEGPDPDYVTPLETSSRWRVLCLANDAGQTGFNEVEMAQSIGGTNECTGGTAAAGSSYGGTYAPSGAFDGNYNSNPSWYGSGVYGNYIEYDFGTPKSIKEFRLVRGDQDGGGTPRLMVFQWYNETTSVWVDYFYGFYTNWVDNTRVYFSKPADSDAYRYWGVINLNGAGGNMDTVVVEWELHSTVGGSDMTTPGGPVRGYHTNSSYPASNLVNDGSEIWYTNNNSQGSFFDYDFGTAVGVAEYQFTGDPGSGNMSRAPGLFHLVASQDGRSYTSVGEYSLTTMDYDGSNTVVVATTTGTPPVVLPRRRAVTIF